MMQLLPCPRCWLPVCLLMSMLMLDVELVYPLLDVGAVVAVICCRLMCSSGSKWTSGHSLWTTLTSVGMPASACTTTSLQ